MTMNRDTVQDLVVAMIAVNSYSLQKAWDLRDGLRKEGFFDFEKLAKLKHEEVFNRLGRAGYSSSEYVQGLLCQRLLGTAQAVIKNPRILSQIEGAVGFEEALKVLDPLPGIGPKVVETFILLRGGASPTK